MKAKRLLSTLLVCVMLFSFMSVTAFAETTEETPAVTSVIYGADGQTIFNATGSGIYDVVDTINMFAGFGGASASLTVNADLTETEKIVIDMPITIDLNGNSVTLDDTADNYAVVVNDSLTINDSSNGDGKIVVPGPYGIGTSQSCTGGVTVNGGTFEAGSSTDYLIGAFGGTVTINGGTFNANYCAVNSFDGYTANVEITDGNFTSSSAEGFTILGNNYNISGGTYESNYVTVMGSGLTITGGTFDSTAYTVYALGNVTIDGGSFTSDTEYTISGEGITVSGGSFDTDVSAYVAEGCEMNSSDGTYGVTVANEAKIGETYYATIEDAIAAAVTGDTVVLLNNAYTGNNAKDCIIIEGKNITLDLNGRTLAQTITDGGASVAAIAIRTDAVLTVKDSVGGGKISATTTPIQLSGTLNLESGTLACDVEPTATDIEYSFLNIVWIYTADALSAPTFNMTGGSLALGETQKTFTYTDAIYFATDITPASNYANASVTISGGSVEGTITAEELEDKVEITGGSFTADISSYIPEGSSVTENADGTYSVAASASWTTDTDAGAYSGGALGMMRYLFALDVEGEATASGIKYIAGNDITSDIKGKATGTASKAFYGDITGISSGTTGTYYAVAYVTIGGKTYWSKPLGNTPDFSKVFTDYTPGGANND